MRHFNSRVPPAAAASFTADDEHNAKRVARELDKILKAAGPRKAAVARASGELRLSTRQIYTLKRAMYRSREHRTPTRQDVAASVAIQRAK